MAKVITFSRTFPKYHPKEGQPTYFIEKFLNSISVDYLNEKYLQKLIDLNTKNIAKGKLSFEDIESLWLSLSIIEDNKLHTIREGKRFEFMDFFSPRCWFGKPYFDPQIFFWDDLPIHNVYDFEIKTAYKELPLDYDTDIIINHKFYHTDNSIMKLIAKNDGLTLSELLQWFKYPKPFSGQIICWDNNISY